MPAYRIAGIVFSLTNLRALTKNRAFSNTRTTMCYLHPEEFVRRSADAVVPVSNAFVHFQDRCACPPTQTLLLVRLYLLRLRACPIHLAHLWGYHWLCCRHYLPVVADCLFSQKNHHGSRPALVQCLTVADRQLHRTRQRFVRCWQNPARLCRCCCPPSLVRI